MMVQKMKSLFTVISLLGILLFAQPGYSQSEKHLNLGEMSLKSWPNPFRPSLANQEGSPFLFDDWIRGSIHSVKGKEYADVRMKFNLLHGRLLIMIEGENNPRMMIPIHIKSFSIPFGDSTYTFQRHLVPINQVKNPMDVFFIEMASGDYFLLVKPGKQAQREDKNVLAQIDEQHNVKYVDLVDYFIETPAGEIIPFKNSKKVRAQIFGDDQAELEKYAKQNKLRWGKPTDLAKIVMRANEQ